MELFEVDPAFYDDPSPVGVTVNPADGPNLVGIQGEPVELSPRTEMLLRLGESLSSAPASRGNHVELLVNGAATYEAMREAITSARHHVHVEFFIFRDDELGRMATEALVRKAREGVEVRVIVDGVGSRGNRRLLRAIREAGGQGARFRGPLPHRRGRPSALDGRVRPCRT